MLQTKMPKGFVFIPVLIGVILLGIVGGAYVYFSQKNSNSQIIQQPLQPNIIPTPVSSQPIPTGSPAANCSTNWPGASSVYSGPTSPLKVCFSDWKIGGLGSIADITVDINSTEDAPNTKLLLTLSEGLQLVSSLPETLDLKKDLTQTIDLKIKLNSLGDQKIQLSLSAEIAKGAIAGGGDVLLLRVQKDQTEASKNYFDIPSPGDQETDQLCSSDNDCPTNYYCARSGPIIYDPKTKQQINDSATCHKNGTAIPL